MVSVSMFESPSDFQSLEIENIASVTHGNGNIIYIFITTMVWMIIR